MQHRTPFRVCFEEFSMSLFSNPSVALLDRLTGIATFLSAIAILATMALAV